MRLPSVVLGVSRLCASWFPAALLALAGCGPGEWPSEPSTASLAGPPRCVGKPGALRGKTQGSVVVKGQTRSFIYYTPSGLDANQPVPLVISPHGLNMSPDDMYVLTGFKEIADREGVAVVFPQGNSGAPWNVGAGVSGLGVFVSNLSADDQSYLTAILSYVEADQCLDNNHVFVSGFSMGGYFSNEVGCLRSDIASIAPHSGGSHDLSACPGPKRPVILFHGEADYLIGYSDNGVVARDRWVQRNGCSAAVDATPVLGGTCEYNRGCPTGAQVALCHFSKTGHAWAGGHGSKSADPNSANAAELAWSFWKRYAW